MTTSVAAFYLHPPAPDYGGMAPESAPGILWGQGTPGAIAPFTTVNKGAIYMQVNGTDDQSHCWMKVDEGEDAQDWALLLLGGASGTTAANTIAQTYVDAELHGFDIAYTGTQASGGNLVALNVAHTTAGTAGAWSSAIYAKITQGSTKNVNGYLSAIECELVNSNTNVSDWFPLVINANSTTLGSHSSFIALRNYGTAVLNSLFWAGDSALIDATGPDSSTLVCGLSGGKETTCSHAVRFIAGGTPYWLLATSTAPA
jgi:hypothetical protein